MKVAIIFILSALVLCVSGFYVASVQSQTNRPLGKSELLKSLNHAKEKKLSNNDQVVQIIVDEIEQSGVDFQMNRKDEAELRAAGANKKIIDAVRKNYRSTPIVKPTPIPTPTPRPAPSKTGEPFNLNEILGWLQKGALSKDIQAAVEARLVNFILEESDESQIASSGGDANLIETIKKSATPEVVAAYYSQLIQEAEGYVMANKWPDAERLLAKAIELMPSKPDAFRLRGEVNLYKVTSNKTQQYADAESDLRSALSLGGKVSFRVWYVCGGQKLCYGQLIVHKGSLTFTTADSSWPLRNDQIENVKPGSQSISREKGGFQVETNIYELKNGKRAKKPNTYDFQARTQSTDEADLIARILAFSKKY